MIVRRSAAPTLFDMVQPLRVAFSVLSRGTRVGRACSFAGCPLSAGSQHTPIVKQHDACTVSDVF